MTARANARKAIERMMDFVDVFIPTENGSHSVLEELPDFGHEADYAISDVLTSVGQRLWTEGPLHRDFRCAARNDLERQRRLLHALIEQNRTRERLELLARCDIGLIDLGVEVSMDCDSEREPDISMLLAYGKEAIEIFCELRDYTNMARAIIEYGNLMRLLEDEALAGSMMRWALHLVRGRCNPDKDFLAACVLQVATYYSLRFFRYYRSSAERERDIDAVLDLAAKIGTPHRFAEAFRSAAGHYIATNRMNAAFAAVNILDKVRASYALPVYGDVTLERPRIEALLALVSKSRGDQSLIKETKRSILKFVELYEANPHFYQRKVLLQWQSIPELDLSFELTNARYVSPALIYLPRY